MPETKFVVATNDDGSPRLFWSNDHGWGDLAGATRFTPEERAALGLPVGGAWIEEPAACELKCPECGNEDLSELRVVETVGKYRDIVSTTTDLPRVVLLDRDEYDDGDSDYRLACRKCGATTELPDEIDVDFA